MKKMFFLALLAVTVIACNQAPCPEKNWENEYLLAKAEVRTLQTEVAQLRVDSAILRGELLCAQSKLLAAGLPVNCIEKPTVKKPVVKAPTPKKPVVKAPTTKESTPIPAPVIQPDPIPVAKTAARMPESVAEISIFDSMKENDGGFRFCVRVNGREDQYFPDYLIRKGIRITGAEDNNRQGYNLLVYDPTEGFDNPNGGITRGGIIYYPAEAIERQMKVQYVDVLFSKNWAPMRMKKTGSWYVYETQR